MIQSLRVFCFLTLVSLVGSIGPSPAYCAQEVGTEFKALLDLDSMMKVLAQYDLRPMTAQTREIFYFDTRQLELFERGIILRARMKGSKSDSTAKIRPLDPKTVAESWFQKKKFKCEVDVSPSRSVSSCSQKHRIDEDHFEAVIRGKRSLKSLFEEDQIQFVKTYGSGVSWGDLEVLGPIDSLVWEEKDSRWGELSWEYWTIASSRFPGERIEFFEVSTKGHPLESYSDFLIWLDQRGIPLARQQSSKTRLSLEFLSEAQ